MSAVARSYPSDVDLPDDRASYQVIAASHEMRASSAVSQQAISSLVARLERNDLLTRKPHPEHGRIQRLAATARGRRVALEADSRVRDVEQALRDHLGEEDSEQLRRLLIRVREFLASRQDEG